MLKKAIKELSEEIVMSIENPAKAPFKIVSFPLGNPLKETMPEEIIIKEEFDSENYPDIQEEVEIEPFSENILPEEIDLVLIENDETEKDSENLHMLKTEGVITEQNNFLAGSGDKKDKNAIITKRDLAYEDQRFSRGSVKWEFGFS